MKNVLEENSGSLSFYDAANGHHTEQKFSNAQMFTEAIFRFILGGKSAGIEQIRPRI